MSVVGQDRNFQTESRKFLDPSLEGVEICHLSFAKLCEGVSDLRNIIKELEDHPTPIRPKDVVVDSDMKLHEAFRGLAADCPAEIVAQQDMIRVFYFGTDGKLHHGNVVIHQELVNDVRQAFKVILREQVPIGSVIPVADPRFERDGYWDDYASMAENNSSGFNYRRTITADGVGNRLSLHGLGMALDVNPTYNPCYGRPVVHNMNDYSKEAAAGYKAVVPANGTYDLSHPGTLHERHPLVLTLEGLGWTWGGRWGTPKDLHHFQKIPNGLEARVHQLRGP